MCEGQGTVTTLQSSGRLPATEYVLVDVIGDLDLASGPSVIERLVQMAGAQTDVVADLSQVTFMDCAGLRALSAAQDQIPGRLWLRSPSRPVAWLIFLTHTEPTFLALPPDGVPPSRSGSLQQADPARDDQHRQQHR